MLCMVVPGTGKQGGAEMQGRPLMLVLAWLQRSLQANMVILYSFPSLDSERPSSGLEPGSPAWQCRAPPCCHEFLASLVMSETGPRKRFPSPWIFHALSVAQVSRQQPSQTSALGASQSSSLGEAEQCPPLTPSTLTCSFGSVLLACQAAVPLWQVLRLRGTGLLG